MTDETHRLAGLAQRLSAAVPDGPQISLVAEDQLVVSQELMRGRGLLRTGKSPTQVPGKAGYQIYVACRTPVEYAASAAYSQRFVDPSSAPVSWDPDTMRLQVDQADLGPEWRLVNSRGQIVTVHAQCGSRRVLDEVNAVLGEIEAVLLA